MDTFLSLLLAQAESRPNGVAIRSKQLGIWDVTTWAQLRDRASVLAQGLSRRGIGKGSKIGVFGPNSADMYSAYAAAHGLGATVVPIGTSTYGDELRQLVHGADVEFVVAVEQQHVDALLECGQTCVREIIYINDRGMGGYERQEMVKIETVLDGLEPSVEHLAELQGQGSPEDVAAIMATSGTGGQAQLIELAQGSLIATARSVAGRKGITARDDLMAYLPLASVSDMLFAYALTMVSGCSMNCPESDDTVLENIQEIGPSILYGPSYVYKYIYAHAANRVEGATDMDAQLYNRALRTVMKAVQYRVAGKAVPPVTWLRSKVALLTTFAPVRNVYGLSRVRLALCGGEAIPPKVFQFFRAIGIELRETYGLAEGCGCVTLQADTDWNSDSVGQPIDGTELRIDGGEVWFRGPGQMRGIYKNPEATAERIRDGWVRTYDKGEIDAEGRLHVHGQIARMGQLRDGSPFEPDQAERHLHSSEYVKQALVVGDGRDYLNAIVAIDGTVCRTWADRRNLRYTGYADLAAHPELRELVRACLEDVNAQLAEEAGESGLQLRRFAIMNREFMASSGELTATRKLRWGVIAERHRELVEALYNGAMEYTYTDAADGRSYTLLLDDVARAD